MAKKKPGLRKRAKLIEKRGLDGIVKQFVRLYDQVAGVVRFEEGPMDHYFRLHCIFLAISGQDFPEQKNLTKVREYKSKNDVI